MAIYVTIISKEILLFQGEKMLSKSLKKIRKENKLGIRELERLSNVIHTIIINIESGKSKNPTIIPIIKLAKALDVSLDELVFGKE